MARLGGGVVHALMGAALWGEHPGIVATVGEGLPAESAALLDSYLDTRGLVQLPIPQMRAWQLFEEDGTRRELYRVKEILPFTRGAQPEHFPAAYADHHGCYLLQGVAEMQAWRDMLKGIVLWEPLQQIMVPENARAIRELLSQCKIDVLSPNLIEARHIYGDLTPDDLVTAMLADGARQVALRMGEAGSIVADQNGSRHHIPAVTPTNIVDQTGAGNTYCGGLLAGLVQGKTLAEAGAMAAVAASFCLEQVGITEPKFAPPVERDLRYQRTLSVGSISR